MARSAFGSLRDRVRTHLILGRVSNLPTVWSDCIAAWVLARGGFIPALLLAMAAMSCLYVGGMYLNDACDAPSDAHYKPSRPIPRGLIHRNAVFYSAFALITFGLVLSFSWGWIPFLGALPLAAAIIVYNFIHLHIRWSPIIMGLCRTLLYLAIGFAAGGDVPILLLLKWSVVIGIYVTGLSFIARVEDTNILRQWTPLVLLFVPVAVNIYPPDNPARIMAGIFPAVWICYCLSYIVRPARRNLPRAVGGLIAGIAGIDLIAASQVMSPNPIIWQVLILACFILALLGQKFIPAT